MASSVTQFFRLEPRPRTNSFGVSLAAPIRDPLWFLTRQWQLGEYHGEDGGSLAYLEYTGRTAAMPRWTVGSQVTNLDPKVPLERQTLAEPFAADLGLSVELGQRFEDLLAARVADATTTAQLVAAFLATAPYAVQAPDDTNQLAPVDPASAHFVQVCVGRTLDGYQLFLLGQAIAAGPGTVPPSVTTDPATVAHVADALADLVDHVTKVYGSIGTTDPATWTPARLEYNLQVVAADPGAKGNFSLDAHPDSSGQFDWFSFDAATAAPTASETPPTPLAFTMVPSNVRFEGMPNPRFWMFEANTLSYVDLKPNKADLMKLIVADFMLIHGAGWYVLPFDMDVGTLARTDSLIVHDVFGHDTLVERADGADHPERGLTAPGPNRWTMFSTTDVSGATESLSNWFVLPPAPGPLAVEGTVLEDVRYARDEMANMAWAVERVTSSVIGDARSGRERDAQIAERQNLPPPEPSTSEAPLRYLIETNVPANWIPLLGVQNDPQNPSIALEKGGVLHPIVGGPPAVVPALGKLLNPAVTPYQIFEEEVPRMGSRVQRVVFRTRWVDGSTHLWVQRRRLAGAGESQAGLRFDQPLPNQK
jgi:hypothetical protein